MPFPKREMLETKLGYQRLFTYPQEQKDGMLYRLREAAATHAPDLFVKIIAELGAKLLTVGKSNSG